MTAVLRFLFLAALLTYAALSLTVAMILMLAGFPLWLALVVGAKFPAVFIWSLF